MPIYCMIDVVGPIDSLAEAHSSQEIQTEQEQQYQHWWSSKDGKMLKLSNTQKDSFSQSARCTRIWDSAKTKEASNDMWSCWR